MTNSWNRTKLKIEEKGLEQEEESEDEKNELRRPDNRTSQTTRGTPR